MSTPLTPPGGGPSSAAARQAILDRIRQALSTPAEKEYPKPDMEGDVFAPLADPDPVMAFAAKFAQKGGQLHYVERPEDFYGAVAAFHRERGWRHVACFEPDLIESLFAAGIPCQTDDQALERIEASYTLCEALVARTGSVVVSSGQGAGRRLTIYPPVHVVVATASQVVVSLREGLEVTRDRYHGILPSMVSVVTGPSRTADIEKTLVLGAHGPKELILFLVDDLGGEEGEPSIPPDTNGQEETPDDLPSDQE